MCICLEDRIARENTGREEVDDEVLTLRAPIVHSDNSLECGYEDG